MGLAKGHLLQKIQVPETAATNFDTFDWLREMDEKYQKKQCPDVCDRFPQPFMKELQDPDSWADSSAYIPISRTRNSCDISDLSREFSITPKADQAVTPFGEFMLNSKIFYDTNQSMNTIAWN